MVKYIDFIRNWTTAEQRRLLFENALQRDEADVQGKFDLLQEIYHLDPDPSNHEWAQGRLQAAGALPLPDLEWLPHGYDGKIYTRQEILTVPDLFIVDPVNRSGFLSKRNGHIKVLWNDTDNQYPLTTIESWAIKSFMTITGAGFIIFICGLCPAFLLELNRSAVLGQKDNTAGTVYVLIAFALCAVGFGGTVIINSLHRIRTTRAFEKAGKLYLGLLSTINVTDEVHNGRGSSQIKVRRYVLRFIFRIEDSNFMYDTRVILGKRKSLESLLLHGEGIPVAVLYTKQCGVRLL